MPAHHLRQWVQVHPAPEGGVVVAGSEVVGVDVEGVVVLLTAEFVIVAVAEFINEHATCLHFLFLLWDCSIYLSRLSTSMIEQLNRDDILLIKDKSFS